MELMIYEFLRYCNEYFLFAKQWFSFVYGYVIKLKLMRCFLLTGVKLQSEILLTNRMVLILPTSTLNLVLLRQVYYAKVIYLVFHILKFLIVIVALILLLIIILFVIRANLSPLQSWVAYKFTYQVLKKIPGRLSNFYTKGKKVKYQKCFCCKNTMFWHYEINSFIFQKGFLKGFKNILKNVQM